MRRNLNSMNASDDVPGSPPARTNRRIRLGIIGCGAIAETMHLPVAAGCPQATVAALIDPNERRTKELADRFGVSRIASNLEQVTGELDAVILATPPHLRVDLARRAFAAGLHVLCEKPLANSAAECDQIIDAARRAECVLAVAHIFRFWPSRGAVRDLIERGDLGTVSRAWVSQGNPYSWQTQTGYNMRTDLVPGGVLFDAGIHPLDTLLWWFGEPLQISYEDDSLGGLESNVRLRMQMASGCEVYFRQSRTCSLSNDFRIEGHTGTVVLSNYDPWRYELIRNGKASFVTASPERVDHLACERRQLSNFIESIVGGGTPFVSGYEGRRVIRLIERCYAERGNRASLAIAPLPGLTW